MFESKRMLMRDPHIIPSQTKENQEKPRNKSLDLLGSIWIPSSESGLFKGLRRFQTKSGSLAS
jgi:hypothetical protein